MLARCLRERRSLATMEFADEPRLFRIELTRLLHGSGYAVAVVPDGDLDLYTRTDLAEALRQAACMPGSCVVVDLRKVAFLDSSALGVLVRAQKLLRAESREVAIVFGGRDTERPFELTGLRRFFRVGYSYAELGLGE